MQMKKKTIILLTALILSSTACFGLLYYNGFTEIQSNPDYIDGQIKVACVGDSVTYGHGIKNQPKNSYPRLLGSLLGDDYNVCNFGVSGSTVQPDGDQPYNITSAYTDSLGYKADILIFMLGSNDSKPENWQGKEKFKEAYLDLLSTYLGDEAPTVYLCTPPEARFPEGVTEGLTNYDIQPLIVREISETVKEIAEEGGYNLIDLYTATENRPELFSKDNVHPNSDGAHFIAEAVCSAIK